MKCLHVALRLTTKCQPTRLLAAYAYVAYKAHSRFTTFTHEGNQVSTKQMSNQAQALKQKGRISFFFFFLSTKSTPTFEFPFTHSQSGSLDLEGSRKAIVMEAFYHLFSCLG
jgi:hypothetical protein